MKGLGLSEDVRALLQPTRYKIIKVLKAQHRSMYVGEIAQEIGEKPRLTSFHLAMLERGGFLESEWNEIKKLNSPRKAGRFFKLTNKVDEVLRSLKRDLDAV